MEENANKLHFKCTDFNSSTRVAMHSKYIYVFYRNLELCYKTHLTLAMLLQYLGN